jgi:hypothetical protein
MFTPEGLKWLADWIADEVKGGWIVVSDGQGNSDVATIDTIVVEENDPQEGEGQVYEVVCTATFGEEVGNFEWAKRSIKLTDGTVIDSNTEDAGRKVQGSVWTAEVTLEVE